MSSSQEFNYGSFEDVKILRIPYESKDQFSMYIFLPDTKDGLQDLLQLFHSDPALFHERFNLTLRHLDELWIPKFKISYKFEAHEVIKQMGLTLPFEPTNLELSRIVEPRVPDQDMPYVSKILQKSFIEINEEGTEAAAWTTGYAKMASAKRPRPPPPAKFVADHPFMFMIREDKSLAVLFIGVVFNPHIDSSA
uniref:serpin-ZX-like n=1 Tax=Erigeron canadensis TaxID=72917 RepID=UPI001CB8AA9E|nr:serpin-ZX-like [Erigeron canadensis]